jgi:hypothetical protein
MNLGNRLAVGEVVDNATEAAPAPAEAQPEVTPVRVADAPEPVVAHAD